MKGSWLAKTFVSDYLAADLPSRLGRYRTEWGFSTAQLPDPVRMMTFEPFTLDRWPTIITLVMGTKSMVRTDLGYDSNVEYLVTYEMRTYVWCRDEGAGEVTRMRDSMATVVREALMDSPSLSVYDSTVPCSPKIMEETIREEFSDLTLVKGERLLAGAYIAYDVTLEETIDSSHEDLGIMQSASAIVVKMPLVPNAPATFYGVAGDTLVDLAWKESTWDGGLFEIEGYTIEQSDDGGDNWSQVIALYTGNDPFYQATGLTNGTTYLFRIAAVNQSGNSVWTQTSNLTPSA